MVDTLQCSECKSALDVLKLPLSADHVAIQLAYCDGVKVWHPDRFADQPRLSIRATEELQAINAAREHLLSHWLPESVAEGEVATHAIHDLPNESAAEDVVDRRGPGRFLKICLRTVWRLTTICLMTLLAAVAGYLVLLVLVKNLMEFWHDQSRPVERHRRFSFVDWFSLAIGMPRAVVLGFIFFVSSAFLAVALTLQTVWAFVEVNVASVLAISALSFAGLTVWAFRKEYRCEYRVRTEQQAPRGFSRYAHLYGAAVLICLSVLPWYTSHSSLWNTVQSEPSTTSATPAAVAHKNTKASAVSLDPAELPNADTAANPDSSIASEPKPSPASRSTDTPASDPTMSTQHSDGESQQPSDADKDAVASTLRRWSEAHTNVEPASMADFYAPHVERYFLARDVSRDFIRVDLEKHEAQRSLIARYDAFTFDISCNGDGRAEISLQKSVSLTDGTHLLVNSKLVLQKQADNWLIVSERDLK